MKERINIYRHVRQWQYQQLAVEEHLRTDGDGKFLIFPFFRDYSRKYIIKKIL